MKTVFCLSMLVILLVKNFKKLSLRDVVFAIILIFISS